MLVANRCYFCVGKRSIVFRCDLNPPYFASSIVRCGGKDFDGCLVFDEAHKAKNFNSMKEENSTKVSQAVIKIQVTTGGCYDTGVWQVAFFG